ncbi:hypothetical protein OMP40_35895 [Cohnella rhizosphaerae]|uniref:Uncharacterized protein n=1 Tax=Cohnella rhizosphaerae TaxID=1457232 RepID=A0A9X4L0Q1_9BACL|nr:hypothetical protein [Cohnella rhizosphaerae]MDG0814073.1 hypothetical protein [Cohnella rhizosphaerae]
MARKTCPWGGTYLPFPCYTSAAYRVKPLRYSCGERPFCFLNAR